MRICVLYRVTPDWKVKYECWKDGFTTAIDIMREKHDIEIINTYNQETIEFDLYDVVIFKEGFDGSIYKKYCDQIQNKIIALCISSSKTVPTDSMLKKYDVLFYETEWYYNYASLERHPHAYHAFGVDTDTMKPDPDIEKEYDVIFIGMMNPIKRPLKILDIPGQRKISIGAFTNRQIVNKLKSGGVKTLDFLPYTELVKYYNKSRLCYVPCTLHGGGERAVLEARACGIPVKIENDNPKLKELLESPIYSSHYYAESLDLGIQEFIKRTNK